MCPTEIWRNVSNSWREDWILTSYIVDLDVSWILSFYGAIVKIFASFEVNGEGL
jgi:hypothetical protein